MTYTLLPEPSRSTEDIWAGTLGKGSVSGTGSLAPVSATWRDPSGWGNKNALHLAVGT